MNEYPYPAPYNGLPYYCKICNMGFDEYIACELTDCELESEEDARSRRDQHLAESKYIA